MRPFILIGGLVLAGNLPLAGCGYDHTRGNPVDQWHYQHMIFLRRDFSQVSIQTYINRTQWKVGLQRQDLYDGDRDGALETAGMDRVAITDYVNVEDPPEKAIVNTGELRDYDALFKEVIGAAKAGMSKHTIEGREYEFHYISQDSEMTIQHPLG